MQKLMAIAGAAILIGSAAHAQEGGAPRAPAGPAWTCGANGYAKTAYGIFGDNDGIAHPYEDAAPCTPKPVQDAAEAIGMGRTHPLGIKEVSTIMYSATGTLAGKPAKVDVQLNYWLPAARVAVTPAGGAATIRVVNDESGWTESKEGVFAAVLPTAGSDLAPFLKLSPFGALRAVEEAEGNAKVTTVAGHTVLSGTSPYDGVPVTITLDEKNQPIAATAKIKGHTYAATYAGWDNKWEPHYLVLFPAKMTITMDGKPYADLDTSYFHSNPYVVFPIPASVPKGAPRPTAIPAVVNGVFTPPAKRVMPADGFLSEIKATGTTPHMTDGHPDLSGDWGGGFPNPAGPGGLRKMGTFEPDQMVMQRSAYLNRPIYKPEYWDKVRSMAFSRVDVDPVYRCHFAGVPRQGAPQRIVETPKELWTMNGFYAGTSTRVVPTDGRKRPDGDFDYSYSLGMPIGHWEGDTMVIDSVGFTDSTWFGYDGYFHTEKMTVQEKLRRDGDLLYYQYTVNDPDVLAEPWTSELYVKRLTADPLAVPGQTEECTEMDTKSLRDVYERG